MTDTDTTAVVTEETFNALVRQASFVQPVLVEFWTPRQAATSTLTPLLVQLVRAYNETVSLTTVNIVEQSRLAKELHVRHAPQVFGFRDGKAVAQFAGLQPLTLLERFIDDLLPTRVDQHVARARSAPKHAAVSELHQALELDPNHREAGLGLARLLVETDPKYAHHLASLHRPDPQAERILTWLSVRDTATNHAALLTAFALDPFDELLGMAVAKTHVANNAYAEAFEILYDVMRLDGPCKNKARAEIVSLMTLLGDADPRVHAVRALLARELY